MRIVHDLWIGSYQSEKIFAEAKSKNIGMASGFAAQKGLINGLDIVLPDYEILDTIGVVAETPYPKNPNITIAQKNWSRNGRSKDVNIGFINIKYFNYISRAIQLLRSTKKWMKNNKGKVNTIFVFAPSVTKLRAAYSIRKKENSKVIVIIPDVPDFVNSGAMGIIRIAKKISGNKIKKLLPKADGFILYTSQMAKYYNIPTEKWMLMEGVIDSKEANNYISPVSIDTSKTIIMYSGALDKKRLIPELLKAFSCLEGQQYELWFTGGGDCEELIYEYEKLDSRIKYFGYLDSRQEVLDLQSKATILLHIRDVNATSADYVFPSKILEYMAIGKPVLSVRIGGIPEQYFNYLFAIETPTTEGLKAAIENVIRCGTNELKIRGQSGRDYVLNEKNETKQANNILDFVRQLNEI